MWQVALLVFLQWPRTFWIFLCHVRLFLCHCHMWGHLCSRRRDIGISFSFLSLPSFAFSPTCLVVGIRIFIGHIGLSIRFPKRFEATSLITPLFVSGISISFSLSESQIPPRHFSRNESTILLEDPKCLFIIARHESFVSFLGIMSTQAAFNLFRRMSNLGAQMRNFELFLR